ncbi:MAG: adhesin [Desulfovibrionales bacterium]|nr:MAG: adhesin [Desulfovibrionales bacterium]
MIEITPSVKDQLDNHFADKAKSPIRIYLAAGCGGERLSLGLDTEQETDLVKEISGYTFIVDKELSNKAGAIMVDMTPYGFSVSSEVQVGGGGGGCGGGCSC